MFSLGALDQFALVNEWQTTREFPHIEFTCQVLFAGVQTSPISFVARVQQRK